MVLCLWYLDIDIQQGNSVRILNGRLQWNRLNNTVKQSWESLWLSKGHCIMKA